MAKRSHVFTLKNIHTIGTIFFTDGCFCERTVKCIPRRKGGFIKDVKRGDVFVKKKIFFFFDAEGVQVFFVQLEPGEIKKFQRVGGNAFKIVPVFDDITDGVFVF